MRTKFRVAVAAVAVGALSVATAAPAGAQEEPAPLGFAVDKTQAQPGTLVLGKADAADVAEHCVTDLEAFQQRFADLLEGPYEPAPGGELFDRIFPSGDFEFTNHTQAAFSLTGIVFLGLSGLIGPEPAEDALPQTFVMTFADIATQEPVGERGNFNPSTGDGSVVVPDIEPGMWAVAAACVGPTFDVDELEAALEQNGQFLQDLGAPADINSPEFAEFVEEFLGGEGGPIEFVTAIGPSLLEPLMVPDAFGAVLFCILDDQGNCPADEPPPPPGLDEDDVDDMTPPAQPVVAAPTFTG